MMLCPSFPSLFCGMGSGHSPPAYEKRRSGPGLQPGTFSSPACAMTSSTRLTSCLAGGPAAYGMPSSSAEPTSAASRPRITRFVADLLAPLGLTNPVTCPGRMAKVISSSAILDPNRLRSPFASMVASMPATLRNRDRTGRHAGERSLPSLAWGASAPSIPPERGTSAGVARLADLTVVDDVDARGQRSVNGWPRAARHARGTWTIRVVRQRGGPRTPQVR